LSRGLIFHRRSPCTWQGTAPPLPADPRRARNYVATIVLLKRKGCKNATGQPSVGPSRYSTRLARSYLEGLAFPVAATTPATAATPAALITLTDATVPSPNKLNPPPAAAAATLPAAVAVTATITVAPSATATGELRPTTCPAAFTTSTM